MSRHWSGGRWLLAGVLLALAGGAVAAGESGPVTPVGGKAPDTGSLRDLRGNRRPLHSFTGYKAVVVAFLGTDCPISNLYLPGLVELEKRYRLKQVQFLAVYPNEHEDLDDIAAHTADHDVPFPVLKDVGQRLADTLGVTRVPAVVVLDGDFKLRYRGRVDDRYGVAFRREKATRDDLVEALDEVLAGKEVSLAETEADGCLVDRPGHAPAREGVTYGKEVSRILQDRCQKCHRPDEAAPFSLLTYDDAVKHGRMIKEVTTQRRMPPWHADRRYGHFVNDRSLTRDQIKTLAAWVDSGMPRGDDKDLPPPVDWPKGWLQGKPDAVFSMPEEFEVSADGVLPYKRWTVDTGFTEDRWVRMAECRPGARSVVHHIVVYILGEGQSEPFQRDGTLSVLAGWAPGDFGLVCPPDTALRVPKGSRLLFEVHYTPNGTAVKDRSSVGITFAKGPPKYEMFVNAFANESILVPANNPHHKAEATLRLPADARLVSLTPHMHWRGKDYRYEIIYPGGRRETILSVPRYDFNWQSYYEFTEPVRLPKGARLHAVAHWDNSRNNPYNPAPEKAVRFGKQTWDEMMVGWVVYVWDRPEEAQDQAGPPLSQADVWFDRLDRNADDVVTADEIPEQVRLLLTAKGVKVPEKMDRKQFAEFFEEMRKQLPQNRTKPAAGGEQKKAEGGTANGKP
jgi:thiol-disulfide isomerase/thioredoxin